MVQGDARGGKDHVRGYVKYLGGEDAENVPVVKQWYALVLATTALPFMREIPSFMSPDRLCGRILVSFTI